MVISGTLFLEDLRRRTLADERLFLLETTFIAGAAALIPQLRLGSFGSGGALNSYIALVCVGAAVAWGILAIFALHHLGNYHRSYALSLLTDGGLLYLALEHEPAEAFRALRRRENSFRMATSPFSAKSFRHRMLVFMRTFAACAVGVGLQPYPAWSRIASTSIATAIFGLVAVFAWISAKSAQAALQELPMPDNMLRTIDQLLVWLMLALATLHHARLSAPKLALVDLLLGEEQAGKAVLTGGG